MNSLQRLTDATRMLDEARTLHDIAQIRDIATAAKAYAKAAQLGIDATNKAAEIKIRAERKAGEFLGQLQKSEGGRPKKTPDRLSGVSEYAGAIEEAQIHERTARRWQKIAAVPEPVFERHIAEVKDERRELTSAGVQRLHRAASNHATADTPGYDGDEWYTPSEYVEAARRVMGSIDLDPASCEAAQKEIKARQYFTKDTNGLEKEWFGNVWINPPYSQPLITNFVDKIIEEVEAERISQCIALTNNSSDTKWFHALLSRYPACFTRGRVQFWRPDHDNFATRQGQTIFYIGPNLPRFAREFSQFGEIVKSI